jgi:heavy metal translocating P-type ATPase
MAFHLVHDSRQRLRLKAPLLSDPAFDEAYLQDYLEAIEEVTSVRVNTLAGSVAIKYTGGGAAKEKILRALQSLPTEVFGNEREFSSRIDVGDVYRSAGVVLLTFLLPRRLVPLVSWLSCFPVIWEGLATLVKEGLKVEVLDATAIALCLQRRDYLTANAINFLLTLGEYLQESTERKSHQLLRQLLKPPLEKTWIEIDGQEKEVEVKSLRVGDLIIGHTGELMPVDGTVVAGEASANQSAITGEYVPAHLKAGVQVLAGSVIEEGHIKYRAERVGAETTLARVGKFITTAIQRPAPYQRESEVLADKLVPLTFGMGAGVFALTRDLQHTAGVFCVDYSCALKLSAPIALRASMYRAATAGVLVRDGRAWERLSKVTTFVFDKTGTLTQRSLQLSKIIPLNGAASEDRILSLAATAEAPYGHPLAMALSQEAAQRGVKLLPRSVAEYIVAHGVSSIIEGRKILVGSRHFLEDDSGIDCHPADARERDLHRDGKSILYVAQDGQLIGLLALNETLRPEAKETLKSLKDMGARRIVMLTGDNRQAAQAIGRKLGIDEVKWELLPEEKAGFIHSLKKEGETVGFIGDGANDAPALISADVGICLREGSSLARETASILLQKDDLLPLPWAYAFSKQTIKSTRENFYLATGLNSGILALTLLGKITPLITSILHNSITVGILLRSLSLSGEEKK